jgi:hypothetical protein
MRFQIEDANYEWEPGTYVVQVTRIEERDSHYGRALLWTFSEPGCADHLVTGMTSTSCSPMSKLVRWVLAATGSELADMRDTELNTDDAIGRMVSVTIEMRESPYGPRAYVVDVTPPPPGTVAAARPPSQAHDNVPF